MRPQPVRSMFGRSAIAALVALTLVPVSAASPKRQAQAAGRPIFDCTGMQATAARLKAGLPVQDGWIRSTEEQIKAARAGVMQSRDAMWALAFKTLTNAATHQLALAREFQDQIENLQGYSPLARQKWLERVKKLKESADDLEKIANSAKAGVDLGPAIAKNRLTLEEFVKQIGESSISDEIGIKAAAFAGPAGVAVVETFLLGRDVSFAFAEGKMSVDELKAAERNLDNMRAARSAVQSRAYELDGIVASPDCAPAVAASKSGTTAPSPAPAPVPPASSPATSSPVPPAKAEPPAPPGSTVTPGGGHGGSVLLGLAVVGGAGYYAYTKLKNCGAGDTGQIGSSCSRGTPNACAAAQAVQEAYCKCMGYSGQYGGNCVK